MKYYFLFILLLSLSFNCTSFGKGASENDLGETMSPVTKPERGYPALVPYVETILSVVSIHSPTLLNQPSPLLEMPKVNEFDPSLPHTKLGDEIYDITKWFPLHEMRAPYIKDADDKRWVYYNVSSGYVIANADHFLQASVYDYIDGSIIEDGLRTKLSMIYVETGDMVAMDLESIQRSPHKVIFRTAGVVRRGEDMVNRIGGVKLETMVTTMNERKGLYLELRFSSEDDLQIVQTHMSFPVSQWLIYECGISEAGKRKLMAIRVDYINKSGQVVHQETSREDFIKCEIHNPARDPFGGNTEAYYKLYPVPLDLVELLTPVNDDNASEEPLEDSVEVTRKDMEITELLSLQGVIAEAYVMPASGYVIAYTREDSHEMLEGLFAYLGGDRPLALRCDLSFYEIDAPEDLEKNDWNVVDLLARNPKKLVTLGMMLNGGERGIHFDGENYCELEAIRSVENKGVEFSLKLAMNFPHLKLEQEFEGMVRTNTPKVISLGINPKTNRMIMMLMRCREIDPGKNTWGLGR